jgi:hypothetical protein
VSVCMYNYIGAVYMKGGTGHLPTPQFTVKRTGRDAMDGIPACINFYYIYHQMFIWKREVFRPVPSKRDPGLCNRDPGLCKRDPGLCNRDPASTGTFSSM